MDIKKGITDNFDTSDTAQDGIRQIAGKLDAAPFTFGLVISRFNPELTNALSDAAVSCLQHYGARPDQITRVRVPGAFEIPTVLEMLAADGTYHALIALGAVIQGETPHAGFINAEVNRALCDIARAYRVPVIDGVVMTHNMEQAMARCTTGEQSRGWYAAKAAIEMAHVTTLLKG